MITLNLKLFKCSNKIGNFFYKKHVNGIRKKRALNGSEITHN